MLIRQIFAIMILKSYILDLIKIMQQLEITLKLENIQLDVKSVEKFKIEEMVGGFCITTNSNF